MNKMKPHAKFYRMCTLIFEFQIFISLHRILYYFYSVIWKRELQCLENHTRRNSLNWSIMAKRLFITRNTILRAQWLFIMIRFMDFQYLNFRFFELGLSITNYYFGKSGLNKIYFCSKLPTLIFSFRSTCRYL